MSTRHSSSYTQGIPSEQSLHESITALNWGQDHGRDPCVRRAVKQPHSPAPGCFQPQRQPTRKVSVCSALPSSTPSLEPFKNSVAKRKQVFKNKRDVLWAPQSLPGSPHPRKKSPKHAERSFKGWITALGVEGPPEAAFSFAISSQHALRKQPQPLRAAEARGTACALPAGLPPQG